MRGRLAELFAIYKYRNVTNWKTGGGVSCDMFNVWLREMSSL